MRFVLIGPEGVSSAESAAATRGARRVEDGGPTHRKHAIAARYDGGAERVAAVRIATAEEFQRLAARWTAAYNQHDRAALLGVDMVLVHGHYAVVDRSDGTKLILGRFAHIWTAAPNGSWLLDRDLWYERSEPAP